MDVKKLKYLFAALVVLLILVVMLLVRIFAAPAAELLPETEPVTEPTAEPTAAPTTEPPTESTEPPFDQEANTFLLTFVGDCTFGSDYRLYGSPGSFGDFVGTDYDYPFRNVAEYFRNDDFTIANLEGVLLDEGYTDKQGFAFHGPVAYTNILTGSSVEAVTLANNHSMDYGRTGYASTVDALTAADVAFVEKDKFTLYTTERGLTIGLVAASFVVNLEQLAQDVEGLRSEGAELIIMAIHWGGEGYYRPIAEQESLAHKMIDCGVDIVYGSHPHVLQKIEEYAGGIIYYSMGNFCFGGNHWPPDSDSVVLQQQVYRDEEGYLHLGELTRIPACVSSNPPQNNFQPTPYPEGSEEYERAMSKLDGSFTGGNLVVNYDS